MKRWLISFAFVLGLLLFARGDTNVSGIASVKVTDGTTTAAVISGTTALKTDLSSVAGTATSTSAAGVQKVGIVGAAGNTLDAATAGVLDVNIKNVNNTASLATASVGSNTVAFSAKRTGTTLMAPQYFASHITSKTTTTPVASTCYVSAIAISVTGAGSSQTLVIQNKEATPKTLYTAGAAIAVGNTYLNFAEPILMTSGIDIVTAGTTAGTQDVFVTCFQ